LIKYGNYEEFAKHFSIVRKEILNDDDNLFRCLILFKYPTPSQSNKYWYHIIEATQTADDPSVNFTKIGELEYDLYDINSALNYFNSTINYD